MNKTLFALIFILCNAIASAADAVDVRVSSSADEVRAGETFYVNFKFSIPKGQHIYSAEESDLGQPTAIKLSLPQGYSLKNIEFPKPEKFTALGMESLGYSRDFSVSAAVSAPENIPESSSVNIRADATWLACSDLCVPGEKSQEIPIRQIKSSASGESAGVPPDKTPLFTVLLAAFLGGAILNLMPCVFPVIGLKILSFAEGAGGSKKSALAGAFFYSLGIVASFLALSAVLLAFRSLGENLGWGFQLQNPMFTSLMAMLFFAMALSFAGVFEIGAGFAGGNVQKNDSNKPEWKKHISAETYFCRIFRSAGSLGGESMHGSVYGFRHGGGACRRRLKLALFRSFCNDWTGNGFPLRGAFGDSGSCARNAAPRSLDGYFKAAAFNTVVRDRNMARMGVFKPNRKHCGNTVGLAYIGSGC